MAKKNNNYRENYSAEIEWISNRIKELRKNKENNYEKFSYEFSINRSSMYRAENLKKGGDISLSFLIHLTSSLGVTMEEFFNGYSDKFTKSESEKKLQNFLDDEKNLKD